MTSLLPPRTGAGRPPANVRRPSRGPVTLEPLAGRGAATSRARERREYSWRRFDWVLAGSVLALCVIGSLLIASATRQYQLDHHLDPYAYLKKHLITVGVGASLAVLTARIDFRSVRAYTPIVYVASLLGLLGVLAVGTTINGARSWIVLPAGFQLQPSEFAKLALVAGLALILGQQRSTGAIGPEATPGVRQMLLALLLAAIPLGLVMMQPDFGTAMVLIVMVVGMLAVSGAPARWVSLLVACGVGFGAAILNFHLLKPYQEARLTEFLQHSKVHASGIGYNVQQALIANAHGQWFGRGLFHGSQTQGQFVPEQKTDFIFTVAGEELGFVGCAVIILLLGVALWRTLSIAQHAPDRFGTLVCVGVVIWLTFQILVNIGMTLGIMPITGLPLPFISYGGSAMFANLVAIGLVENIRLRTPKRVTGH
jgi:rod shape determining protein RodA